MGGARIRLHMFEDRLELYVPGALANTLTPDSLHLRQYSRNELVVSLLARCPMPGGDPAGRPFLMDRRGDGVPIIQEETMRLAGRPAEYTLIDDSELRLILPSAGLDTFGAEIG
jgi:predicted HTH transcriptional regulator